ncbi:hypothetical protein Dsin_026403 [Dipteronia sinensis]|uniref:Uncharacterized protein n=1 Tax=Dipteronia sinensis TaxID=43782 RepID=A0AAE0DXZ9_9ROSI|nr:hypothetical protein Dsin_026403 [Dipteronia sinensis]
MTQPYYKVILLDGALRVDRVDEFDVLESAWVPIPLKQPIMQTDLEATNVIGSQDGQDLRVRMLAKSDSASLESLNELDSAEVVLLDGPRKLERVGFHSHVSRIRQLSIFGNDEGISDPGFNSYLTHLDKVQTGFIEVHLETEGYSIWWCGS